MSVSSSDSGGDTVFPKPIDDVSSLSRERTDSIHDIRCSIGPPHRVPPHGIIVNQPSTFVKGGQDRYSQASDADHDDSEGHLAATPKQAGIQFPNESEGNAGGGAESSQIISDTVRDQAYKLVLDVIVDNPRAHGIVLLIHNEDVHPEMPDRTNLSTLQGIENGTRDLKNCFANLGLAVVRLENPPKELLRAVIEVTSETHFLPSQPPIEYPQSYRYLFFYTTGHGANRVFFTKDGSVAYYDVVIPFRKNKRFQQIKYFFFDCCRSLRIDDHSLYPNNDKVMPDVPELDLQHGECIIYATTGYSEAWGPGEGVSHMTLEMIKLLRIREQLSLDELVTRLRESVHHVAEEVQCPATFSAISQRVSLWSELYGAMQPSVSQPRFENGGSGAHFSVQLSKPPLADSDPNSSVEKCEVKIKRDGADWVNLKPSENGTSLPAKLRMSVDLPTDRRTENQSADFRVVVHYRGGTTVMSETISTTLPDLAKPVCTAVNLKGVCCPKLGVRWTQELQRELHVDRYEVTVKSPGKVTLTKTFPVNHEKSTYCEPISVPGLSKRGQVVVGVSAKRGGNKPQISSDDFKKSFNKELCKRRVSALLFFDVLLLGLLVLSLSGISSNSVTRNNLSTQRKVLVSHSASEVAYGVKKSFNSFGLSFLSWRVSQCDTSQDPLGIFCAAYNTSQLSSNRRIEYLSADDTFTELNRTISLGRYSLPFSAVGPDSAFSSYLLKGSLVFVEVCPSITRHDELLHKMEFVMLDNWHALYNYVRNNPDLNQSSVIAAKEISFKYGDVCRNYTLQINWSTYVYFAVSTSEVILNLKELSGSIERLYYSTKGLGLLKDKNRLEDVPKTISGDSISDLICSARYSETMIELCVSDDLNFNAYFFLLVSVLIIIVLTCMCVSICICNECVCHGKNQPNGYHLLPVGDEV